jgi:hypothetical protein
MKNFPALTPRFLIVGLLILNLPLPLSRSIKSALQVVEISKNASPLQVSVRFYAFRSRPFTTTTFSFLVNDGEIACVRKQGYRGIRFPLSDPPASPCLNPGVVAVAAISLIFILSSSAKIR